MNLPKKYDGTSAGPWEQDETDVRDEGQMVLDANGDPVADVKLKGRTGECEANALLIADGPMLACRVEVLEQLVDDLWWFIENVNEESPDRTDRFFALRVQVREALPSGAPQPPRPTLEG